MFLKSWSTYLVFSWHVVWPSVILLWCLSILHYCCGWVILVWSGFGYSFSCCLLPRDLFINNYLFFSFLDTNFILLLWCLQHNDLLFYHLLCYSLFNSFHPHNMLNFSFFDRFRRLSWLVIHTRTFFLLLLLALTLWSRLLLHLLEHIDALKLFLLLLHEGLYLHIHVFNLIM